jgi:DNA-binding NarL/FixJ family response regulator
VDPAPTAAALEDTDRTIRVLIADDQAMIRTGFRLILEAEDDMTVVGEAADGETAIRSALALRPDVTLMDIRMPGIDGIEATRVLAGESVADPLAVVVVTTYDLDENLHAALRAGALGFLLKDAGPALLVEAVRAAANGDSLVSPSMTRRLLATGGLPDPTDLTDLKEPLTTRETDVVRLVAQGLTNAEITEKLVVSMSTVKTHLSAIQRKLGARNRTEIAIWAWRRRLVR